MDHGGESRFRLTPVSCSKLVSSNIHFIFKCLFLIVFYLCTSECGSVHMNSVFGEAGRWHQTH